MIRALYAGSFDPVTNGHLDIITRAAKLFGGLTVLVMQNTNKTSLFSLQERVELLRQVTANIPGVCVETADGLLADYARQHNVQILVRGVRGPQDIEPELAAAHFNSRFYPGLETVFLPTSLTWKYVSSSLVKEAAGAGGDISSFVPQVVAKAVKSKLG
ncbi:pantetheine-phosphate adenylyltransferase [Candidatus Avelusimicrobium luingense]|uniref:pantetheine-phosphate adenylyltransferase n=1 Tax=Candidatus Avelusimicrobium luingense TaxID=3416211 RepID=UPI003D0C3B00